MADIEVNINGASRTIKGVAEDMPLLWAIRDILMLNGTKFGCGKALCGACTVHMDGRAIRSCITPVGSVEGKKITTIEGLSENGDHPLQKAWMEVNVPQCGYCQSGQIMNAAAFLNDNPNPSDEEITKAMAGNICRCGTYTRIKEAIQMAAEKGGMG
ncbi:(2Fe-2S)-binding protein [Xanthovirga aplysinae]|uniref:(2Fe-2S)-binding protein n=1 Tax=Xanthovirga aplysinae TaxID=2529853 RepID=UPI0012BBA009|nr:(2Fe-2S)-binding protein [Xanthovirga aplysinae]MTI32882.1 (2Fe-2S)-binding protein [Xanthovirga aplysinae]